MPATGMRHQHHDSGDGENRVFSHRASILCSSNWGFGAAHDNRSDRFGRRSVAGRVKCAPCPAPMKILSTSSAPPSRGEQEAIVEHLAAGGDAWC